MNIILCMQDLIEYLLHWNMCRPEYIYHVVQVLFHILYTFVSSA